MSNSPMVHDAFLHQLRSNEISLLYPFHHLSKYIITQDLANIISLQQDQVDEIQGTMEQANKHTEQ